MGTYQATVKWRRRPGEVFTDNRFSRSHEWDFDGGATIKASSSPLSVRAPYSDPGGVDPEEALVAALSSCHMLFFLFFAAKQGFQVASYTDNAKAELAKGPDGKEWLTRVTLNPDIVFDGDKRPAQTEVDALHHAAHEACYIANSVKSEIAVAGTARGII
jgi:organic hydroperoxide reductase OsmC/OhrA